ncbi:hypothetical protein PtrSN002B_005543 [Pyrenophora tritici-repentis]|uniref:Uncharacterized protein n=2 Tax=Pyrenophora tritici-repentis TaxID=45151 RepID=A0A2W1F7M5_9PLEO|nr:uncharacterized protein PTRG_04900 [Pyrenophora tritici-repentis Pt-1C-BFP]KAA8611968.1 hypothetical protein PtrV1_13844 [Pyrenophora tritici-repentis]EDU47807.1 predicted protein [Pyrenophora tritici-repentis Pt-1C-BFP]KAF7569465.1 hypothetical protein PtrM4_118800 [Pyrenophora tritici-repentis]KAG9382773.1 hypothetical protein A1F94_006694 [Pyrenophora tritici-repentis]KAI0586768.1 hypothetical protein Alg215_01806 [Pyrenophora tritici-repentis]
MESIVSKVQVELVNLAATYADAGHENVTLSLIFDFQRALFVILDESIRIKDLEQCEGLKYEMEDLFKDEYPTKPGWPYLNQLDKQDRCFSKIGCRFKHGAALYKSPLCEEHFVCKKHQSGPCLAIHKNVLGQEQRARDTKNTKRMAVDGEESSTERLVRGGQGKEMSGIGSSDKTNAGKGGLDNERPPKAIEKETVGKERLARDVENAWEGVSDDRGSSSSDESEWDDNLVNGEGMNQQNAEVGR